MGAIRARLGGTLEGSPLEVLADQALIAEEDAMLIRFGGETRAQEQELRAQQFGRAGVGSLLTGIAGGGISFGSAALSASASGRPFFGSSTPAANLPAGTIPVNPVQDELESFFDFQL